MTDAPSTPSPSGADDYTPLAADPALGTDAGGSVRGPAALCGHVGLKQTHGLVSLAGAVFNTWSGDHVGPHTKTAGAFMTAARLTPSWNAPSLVAPSPKNAIATPGSPRSFFPHASPAA